MSIVLLYHDVVPLGCDDESGFPGPSAAHYKLTPTEFRKHLGQLRQATTNAPAIVANAPNWAITFDDGGFLL